jgi:hypothetical protein
VSVQKAAGLEGPLARLYRPPIVGLLAFLVVLFTQPLGHTVMIVTEDVFGSQYEYAIAALMGVLGAALVYIGSKQSEVPATWLGYFGGTFIWSFWVEFSFVFYSRHLGVAPLIENGEIVTKPEYLVMPSSLGLLLGLLVFFAVNKDSKCNLFRWLHRNLHMGLGRPESGRGRNIAAIVAIETIVIIWFFYLLLLIIYDQSILGDRHPVTYMVCFASLAWAMYLLRRLLLFSRLTAAIRYAIPTAIIAWNAVEILGRWNLFTEIWVHPADYMVEMTGVFGALVLVTAVLILMPTASARPDEA